LNVGLDLLNHAFSFGIRHARGEPAGAAGDKVIPVMIGGP
jgi:hypothetical protein